MASQGPGCSPLGFSALLTEHGVLAARGTRGEDSRALGLGSSWARSAKWPCERQVRDKAAGALNLDKAPQAKSRLADGWLTSQVRAGVRRGAEAGKQRCRTNGKPGVNAGAPQTEPWASASLLAQSTSSCRPQLPWAGPPQWKPDLAPNPHTHLHKPL